MELFQLRSFIALGDAGSVTAAADRLCLTQPAVTQPLQSLERELGVRLFERTSRGVVLTQAGGVFRDFVLRGMASLEEGRMAACDVESGQSGRLLLGAGVTTSVFHLPEWLREFQTLFPTIDVVVRTGRSAQIARMVLGREIDLGIVTSSAPTNDLTCIPLFEEEIVLVMSRKMAPGSYVPAAKLGRLPIIAFARSTGFRAYLDQVLQQAGIDVQVKMESDSVEAIKSFVAVGLGASFLPERSVAAEIASGDLMRVPVRGLPELRRQTAIIHRASGHLNGAARAFLELARGRYGKED